MTSLALANILPAALLLLAAAACIPLALIALGRRSVAGAMSLAAMALAIFLWTTANGLQLLLQLRESPGIATVAFSGIALLPVAWISFAIQSTGRRLPRMVLALGSIAWLLTVILVATNESHGFVWRLTYRDGHLVQERWWYFWSFASYSYLTVLTGILWLLIHFGRCSSIYRRQGLIMAGAGLIPLIVSVLYISKIIPRAPFDPTPIAFLASLTLASWALFKLRLFELVPIAPEVLLQQISDGLLVVDRKERLIILNPVAARLFNCNLDDVIGKKAESVLPIWSRLRPLLDQAAHNPQGEVVLENQDNSAHPVHLEVRLTPLDDHGLVSGCLLLFRDVSESRRRASEREQMLASLQTALAQVKKLSGLLPICAACKKIRDSQNQWHPLESFIRKHSEAEFSHGLCPQCLQKYEEDIDPSDSTLPVKPL
jgi:hypothetical protein